MTGLQVELAMMLGITAEKIRMLTGKEGLVSRKEAEVILSELDKVNEEIGQLLHADGEIYEGNSRLNLLRSQLRKKLEAIPVPANFDEGKKIIEKGSRKYDKPREEPATPQPEDEPYQKDEDIEDEFKAEKDAERKIVGPREEDSREQNQTLQ